MKPMMKNLFVIVLILVTVIAGITQGSVDIYAEPEPLIIGEEAKFLCNVTTGITSGINFQTRPNDPKGSCLAPYTACSSGIAGYSVAQISNYTLELTIAAVDKTRDAGTWYCLHDVTESSDLTPTIATNISCSAISVPSLPSSSSGDLTANFTTPCTYPVPTVSLVAVSVSSGSQTGITATTTPTNVTCGDGEQSLDIQFTTSGLTCDNYFMLKGNHPVTTCTVNTSVVTFPGCPTTDSTTDTNTTGGTDKTCNNTETDPNGAFYIAAIIIAVLLCVAGLGFVGYAYKQDKGASLNIITGMVVACGGFAVVDIVFIIVTAVKACDASKGSALGAIIAPVLSAILCLVYIVVIKVVVPKMRPTRPPPNQPGSPRDRIPRNTQPPPDSQAGNTSNNSGRSETRTETKPRQLPIRNNQTAPESLGNGSQKETDSVTSTPRPLPVRSGKLPPLSATSTSNVTPQVDPETEPEPEAGKPEKPKKKKKKKNKDRQPETSIAED